MAPDYLERTAMATPKEQNAVKVFDRCENDSDNQTFSVEGFIERVCMAEVYTGA
jgi:hypothetical protein